MTVARPGTTISGNVAQFGGGGISSSGDLTVTAATIGGNTAGSSGGGILGGNVTVIGSTITGNSATLSGGGISTAGNLTVTATTIGDNTAGGSGGGISSSGDLTVTASSIGNNTAGSSGGGILATGSSVVLDASTVAANSANGEGGGVSSTSDNLSIIDSTLSANVAVGHGGGIYIAPLNPGQLAASIAYSTVANNRADAGNTSNRFGGGLFVRAGAVLLDHSIVAENYNTTIFGIRSDVAGLLGATIDAQWSLIGHNADSGLAEAPVGSPDSQGNLIGGAVGGAIDPLLGPLVGNGGPTRTHALLSDSPARNMGDPAAAAGINGVPQFDQRRAPFGRVFGGRIDIGAYELQSLPAGSLVVDTLVDESDGDYSAGDLSLREATELARGSVLTADSITFAASLTSGGPASIVLTLGELAITDALSIIGPGQHLLTIDASGNDLTPEEINGDGSRIFNIDDGNFDTQFDASISGLTLTGGDASGSGGAIFSQENLAVTSSTISGNSAIFDSGGGIFGYSYYGNVTVTSSTISGNSAGYDGGGIHANNLTVINSTITGNLTGGSGGGIYSDNLTVTNTTVSGNSASSYGGGIYGFNLAVANSTVSGNSTDGSGGGISGGYVSVTGSIVSGNSAYYDGGGISGGYVSVTLSTISGNSATNGSGGGIQSSYSYYGSFTVKRSTVSGNSAYEGGGNYGGYVTVTGSTVSGNSAGYSGGGIYNNYGDLTVTSSTISGNSADSGGGIWSYTELSGVRTSIVGSTISGNTAVSTGGGLYNVNGLTVIEFSTITGNQAPAGAGSGVASFGDSYTRTRVRSSIIVGNVNSDVNFVTDGTNSFLSSGYNLIGTGNALGRFNQFGDQTGVFNPLLGPLANNAGPTKTHALLPGSPAIDAGDPAAVAGVGGVPPLDQRGAPFVRVYDGDDIGGARIDVGAFELQPIVGPELPGDYNDDGIVGAADYTVYRNTLGTSGIPAFSAADGSGNGVVDRADYSVWKAHFGETLPDEGSVAAFAQQPPALPGVGTAEIFAHVGATFKPPAKPGADVPVGNPTVASPPSDAVFTLLGQQSPARSSAAVVKTTLRSATVDAAVADSLLLVRHRRAAPTPADDSARTADDPWQGTNTRRERTCDLEAKWHRGRVPFNPGNLALRR